MGSGEHRGERIADGAPADGGRGAEFLDDEGHRFEEAAFFPDGKRILLRQKTRDTATEVTCGTFRAANCARSRRKGFPVRSSPPDGKRRPCGTAG